MAVVKNKLHMAYRLSKRHTVIVETIEALQRMGNMTPDVAMVASQPEVNSTAFEVDLDLSGLVNLLVPDRTMVASLHGRYLEMYAGIAEGRFLFVKGVQHTAPIRAYPTTPVGMSILKFLRECPYSSIDGIAENCFISRPTVQYYMKHFAEDIGIFGKYKRFQILDAVREGKVVFFEKSRD